MKKFLTFALAGAVLLIIAVPLTWAQENDTEEFVLEDIIVTAEKREVNVQDIPASIEVLAGADLVEQGKVTVAQMLENVPNLVYQSSGELGRGGPNNNIIIRGIKRTQEAGGPGPLPSATSTYVDGVFDGVGGNFDIDRIEVLRGPQGTLYGRSSTGGVVSFHTKNPKLGEFEGNVMFEYGSASRINTQGAINVPLGDKVALRAAVHYFSQDEGYFSDDEGKGLETTEGRIKALFQPNDQFRAVLSLSATQVRDKTGGWTSRLTGPNEIDYEVDYTEVGDAIPEDFEQASLELNYDLGDSVLTYIGAIHSHEFTGQSGASIARGFASSNLVTGEPSETQTHEIRWASDTEGPFAWLIGANHYEYEFEWQNQVIQNFMVLDDDPATVDAPLFGQYNKGDIKDYGIFTEETFELRDDMRITAGLRYDKTEMTTFMGYDFNINLKANGASLNPPIILHFPEDAVYTLITPEFDNWTYKLRFEYELTPDNMLYALTATGFLPGSAHYSCMPTFGPLPGGGFGVIAADFLPFIYEEEELKSYEIGSKNRFLDDTLQVNAALFYMDYEGYQEAINILPPDQPPPPKFVILRLPVEIYGLEVDAQWLLTQYDRVTLTGSWLDAEATGYPQIPVPGEPDEMTSAKPYMSLKRIPGLPEVSANLTYDHTFLFGNDSSLVPRAELRYTSSYYLGQATEVEVEHGFLPYLDQDSLVLLNIGATWYSPQNNFTITGYVRNVTDEEYKTSVLLPAGPEDPTVWVGDPRTFGMIISYRF